MSVSEDAGAGTFTSFGEVVEVLRNGGVLDATALYIDGAWSRSTNAETIDVVGPDTELIIARVAEGSEEDVDRAVAAARDALPAWSATPAAQRAEYLERAGAVLADRVDVLSEIASRDIGVPLEFARLVHIGLPVFNLAYYANLCRSYDFGQDDGSDTLIVRDPVGVVACITPWNFPAHQVVLKVAAALAAGCTVVVKPSEVAPLLVHAIAAAFDEVGLPPGVFNLVSGAGPVVGEALVAHAGVDMVSFTGSTRAGKRIAEVAARTVKRVTLELGGKSASVILDDADLAAAIANGLANSIGVNSGQACSAQTRLLVPASQLDEAEQMAAEFVGAYQVGAWNEPGAAVGPLISEAQQQRVMAYIRQGIDEGARVVAGGLGPTRASGYFVEPTVFSDVTPGMVVAREEIFGPVVVIIPYDGDDEAVRIANDTIYGLAAAVWSADGEHALRVARRIHAGQVHLNGGNTNFSAPFGGYKQSGLGREGGVAGLEEFLETKAILR